MCDPGRVRAWLAGASAAIITSIALIGVAIGLNASFFGAPGAPVPLVAAGVSAGTAVALLSQAVSALDAFCACLQERGHHACVGICRNLRTNLDAIRVVVGIQATACFAAAGIAWIPWAGAAPMVVIGGALVAQVFLLISAMAFYVQLENCVAESARTIRLMSIAMTAAFSIALLVGRLAHSGFSAASG